MIKQFHAHVQRCIAQRAKPLPYHKWIRLVDTLQRIGD